MTYQQAKIMAYIKLVSGWIIFAVCLLWSVFGALKSLLVYSQQVVNKASKGEEAGLDFIFGIMTSVIKTLDKGLSDMPVMGFYWASAPTPVIGEWVMGNIGYLLIFWGMFLGMALVQSSDKLFSQVRNVKQTVQSLLFIESARGEKVQSAPELIAQLTLKHHSVFLQYFPLYIFPIIIVTIVKFTLGFLGL